MVHRPRTKNSFDRLGLWALVILLVFSAVIWFNHWLEMENQPVYSVNSQAPKIVFSHSSHEPKKTLTLTARKNQPTVQANPKPQLQNVPANSSNILREAAKPAGTRAASLWEMFVNNESEYVAYLRQNQQFNSANIKDLIAVADKASNEETMLATINTLGSLVNDASARQYLLDGLKKDWPETVQKAALLNLGQKIDVYLEIPTTFYELYKDQRYQNIRTDLVEALVHFELLKQGLAYERSPALLEKKKDQLQQISDPYIKQVVFQTLQLDAP